jgi:hypothetical protein
VNKEDINPANGQIRPVKEEGGDAISVIDSM